MINILVIRDIIKRHRILIGEGKVRICNACDRDVVFYQDKKQAKQYIENFKTKRSDSKEYSEAVNFLKTYFDPSNKIDIDL